MERIYDTLPELTYPERVQALYKLMHEADAIVIGAGSGFSTAAGYDFGGPLFNEYFSQFQKKYGFDDAYAGIFYPYPSKEEFWAFWSCLCYVFRYREDSNETYQMLKQLFHDFNHFIITTNVDHQFITNGFDKTKLFYTQGSFGLIQCATPCHQETYDASDLLIAMYQQTDENLKIPKELVPVCPKCGGPMTKNGRVDSRFVQDQGWYQAKERYTNFLEKNKDKRILYLEMGVGYNTPVIIKYPFLRMARENPKAYYVNLSVEKQPIPDYLLDRAMPIYGDLALPIKDLYSLSQQGGH